MTQSGKWGSGKRNERGCRRCLHCIAMAMKEEQFEVRQVSDGFSERIGRCRSLFLKHLPR